MVFRVNFLSFWIISNAAFALIIENYSINPEEQRKEGEPILKNGGQMGFLEIFALYLASLVLYRVIFGAIHIIKFKVMRNCIKKYKTPKFNLHEDVKQLRKEIKDWNESVGENDMSILQDAERDPDDQLLNSVNEYYSKGGIRQKVKNRVNKLEQTCIDTDDDDLEFDSAKEEEEEDMMVHERSCFMVSRTNMSRYQEERSIRMGPGGMNKILDTNEIIGEEEDDESFHDKVDMYKDVDKKKESNTILKNMSQDESKRTESQSSRLESSVKVRKADESNVSINQDLGKSDDEDIQMDKRVDSQDVARLKSDNVKVMFNNPNKSQESTNLAQRSKDISA